MQELTRSMVAYDLTISPHKCAVEYGNGDRVEFVFSSDLYRRKFEERFEVNRKEINESLSNRFKFVIRADLIADIRLYSIIEKRGFLLYNNGKELICQEEVSLAGPQII